MHLQSIDCNNRFLNACLHKLWLCGHFDTSILTAIEYHMQYFQILYFLYVYMFCTDK